MRTDSSDPSQSSSHKAATRATLTAVVHRQLGLAQSDSRRIVDDIFDLLEASLARGEQVKIASFGTFHIRAKGARIGRNPKTGEEVPIPPRRVVSFRASPLLRKVLKESL